MRMIKKWQILTLLLTNLVTFNACSKAPAENSQVNSKSVDQQKTEKVQQQISKINSSPVQKEIDNAKNAGKAVFVVVTGSGVTNTGEAKTIAKGANEIYKNAIIVEMNRDDAVNESLVTEWRLSGAPLPLILVISSKGVLAGGYVLEDATSENIAAFIPSPKLEKVYESIGNNKYAVIAFTKKTFADRAEVLKECNEAVTMLKDEAVFIEVDMEDKKETSFMQQLRISPLTTKSSVTLVINKQGQVSGQSTTIPDAAKLVAAAKAPVSSGCGPGCGPAGCGK